MTICPSWRADTLFGKPFRLQWSLKDGVHAEVINIHTIKPLDVDTIVESAKRTGAVLVAEEHQLAGGLGESVAQTLAQHHPTPMAFVAVNDSFGESGTPLTIDGKVWVECWQHCHEI